MELTNEQIESAILAIRERHGPHVGTEHPDCVRLAAAWLAAQPRTADGKPGDQGGIPVKHLIERWAGRYVSLYDVEAAAHLLGIAGRYGCLAIERRLVRPSRARLSGIGQAFAHDYARRGSPASAYRGGEEGGYGA